MSPSRHLRQDHPKKSATTTRTTMTKIKWLLVASVLVIAVWSGYTAYLLGAFDEAPEKCYTVGLDWVPTALQIETSDPVALEGGCLHIYGETHKALCGVKAFEDSCEATPTPKEEVR